MGEERDQERRGPLAVDGPEIRPSMWKKKSMSSGLSLISLSQSSLTLANCFFGLDEMRMTRERNPAQGPGNPVPEHPAPCMQIQVPDPCVSHEILSPGDALHMLPGEGQARVCI